MKTLVLQKGGILSSLLKIPVYRGVALLWFSLSLAVG